MWASLNLALFFPIIAILAGKHGYLEADGVLEGGTPPIFFSVFFSHVIAEGVSQ
jgi:hypothetical protein